MTICHDDAVGLKVAHQHDMSSMSLVGTQMTRSIGAEGAAEVERQAERFAILGG